MANTTTQDLQATLHDVIIELRHLHIENDQLKRQFAATQAATLTGLLAAFFADDIQPILDTQEEGQRLLDIASCWCLDNGMETNIAKLSRVRDTHASHSPVLFPDMLVSDLVELYGYVG